MNNLTLKNGGSKQTVDLFDRASNLYEEHMKECKYSTVTTFKLHITQRILVKKKDKSANKSKMLKDPIFESIVDKVIVNFLLGQNLLHKCSIDDCRVED